MFYSERPDSQLRFGDVVKGAVCACSNVQELLASGAEDFTIDVRQPKFGVILTPCCSIDKSVAIAPLERLQPGWLRNPYWKENFARINRRMAAKLHVPPEALDKMPADEKARRFPAGIEAQEFPLSEYFSYEPNEMLPTYEVAKHGQTGYYVISFKRISQMSCSAIASASSHSVATKILELSPLSRKELREKIAWFWGRPTREDGLLLGETG